MEKKMTSEQELLFEARKKKPFRAFISACMWGGFGLYYTGKTVLPTIMSILCVYYLFSGVYNLFTFDITGCIGDIMSVLGVWILCIIMASPMAENENKRIKEQILNSTGK